MKRTNDLMYWGFLTTFNLITALQGGAWWNGAAFILHVVCLGVMLYVYIFKKYKDE